MEPEVVDPYSIHRALETFNRLPTQAAPTFEAAWSKVETEPELMEYSNERSRVTTALLIVLVSAVALVTIWFVAKFFAEHDDTNSVTAQHISSDAGGSPTPDDPAPTFTMPDNIPNADTVLDRDSRYVNALRVRGVIANSKAAAVESAQDMCASKSEGYTQEQLIAAIVQANPKLDARQAPIIVSTAIEMYCPA